MPLPVENGGLYWSITSKNVENRAGVFKFGYGAPCRGLAHPVDRAGVHCQLEGEAGEHGLRLPSTSAEKAKNSLHFLGLEGGDRLKSDLSLLLTLWRNCLHRFPISRRVISRINHDNGATM